MYIEYIMNLCHKLTVVSALLLSQIAFVRKQQQQLQQQEQLQWARDMFGPGTAWDTYQMI